MPFYISRFKGMEKQEFEVEIVTPLFLGGADPQQAELRVPSIKGALRFWWRALHPHFSLAELKKHEAEIFGDAGDSKNSFGKSRVCIQLVKDLPFENIRYNPVPHKRVNFKFPCFYVGNKFALKIYGDEKIFNLFKLFSIVGGLGKRSRRGFGSIMINKINGEAFSFDYSLKEIFSLIKSIVENSYKINNTRIVRTGIVHSEAKYAYVKNIEFGQKPYDNHKAILETIGQSSHNNKSDYTGYARGQERFSSPIYVSVLKNGNKYSSVVTTLNTAFKNSTQNHGSDESMQFKKDILSGGSR
ncbi:MAG TPA: type III-B CRISPR module RAMP protein Cmr1 [Desulfobacterales bacterium]|nr:type III-B CRISPR module RAMP protein Cmr1 [Desulfobacterales bacterium]